MTPDDAEPAVRPDQPQAAKPPIVVLLGGPSAEHDVSIVSGTAIGEALAGAGYATRLAVIDLGGNWWWLPLDHRREGRPPSAYDDPGTLGADGPVRFGGAIERLRDANAAPVVFVALHGPYGEDGTVQALLEAGGLAYTGSGVAASAIGMDKAISKRLWRGLGLPVADWREIRATGWRSDPAAVLAELEAFAASGGDARLMIKPARLGSSVGMTLAHDADERRTALDHAFRYDTLALAERYVDGARDIEVSVIGNEPPLELYGPGEVITGHEFYDYEAKYTPGLSEVSPRAELPDRMRNLILKLSRDAYRAIGAEGFARVDFLLAGDRPILSEINTMPGFTPASLFPVMAAEGGYDFAGVCIRLVDLAIDRHRSTRVADLTPADLPR
jgi:D-alanine-D-alanine ligase